MYTYYMFLPNKAGKCLKIFTTKIVCWQFWDESKGIWISRCSSQNSWQWGRKSTGSVRSRCDCRGLHLLPGGVEHLEKKLRFSSVTGAKSWKKRSRRGERWCGLGGRSCCSRRWLRLSLAPLSLGYTINTPRSTASRSVSLHYVSISFSWLCLTVN